MKKIIDAIECFVLLLFIIVVAIFESILYLFKKLASFIILNIYCLIALVFNLEDKNNDKNIRNR